MASKNGKIQRIEIIKEKLRQGLDRKDILPELTKTYKVSPKTIDNELKEAREVISGEMLAKEGIRQSILSEQVKSEINASIKSDLELDLILSEIATAGFEVEEYLKGDVITRSITPMEQITAIDKLYKRRGSYAPLKQAQTSVTGEDVKTELSDKQLEKLLNAITNPG
jgi:hypothetical protein